MLLFLFSPLTNRSTWCRIKIGLQPVDLGGMDMNDYRMGQAETRFAEIIWENEPISSTELARSCEAQLQWKKSTTYTVLKRLCGKGIFRNDNGTVTSLLSRDEFFAAQSEKFVEEHFNGSLPAFLAAFTARKQLTAEEAAYLLRMISEYKEEG